MESLRYDGLVQGVRCARHVHTQALTWSLAAPSYAARYERNRLHLDREVTSPTSGQRVGTRTLRVLVWSGGNVCAPAGHDRQ